MTHTHTHIHTWKNNETKVTTNYSHNNILYIRFKSQLLHSFSPPGSES